MSTQVITNKDKLFSDMVNSILLSSEKLYFKVNKYQREIDQMIYELYGLTKKEIDTIENLGQQ